jgi:hypothetical protein
VSELNIHLTPELERALRRLMQLRGIASTSEAVHLAVQEALRTGADARGGGFAHSRGAARRAPLNPNPRFDDEDEL